MGQFGCGVLPQILRFLDLRPLHLNAKNPPVFVVPRVGLGLVAGVLVVPVDQVNLAAGAPLHIDRAEVLV
ncbi:MAG: hypothetical protein ACJ8F7_16570, partial [Gemmataceae bacterium]